MVVPALAPEDQALFARLAVFSGGCTYEAAEEIADADPDILQSLLDKSLLRKRDSPLGRRYWMLETIGEYAAEKLEASGDAERLRRRHLALYVALATDVDERGKVGEYDIGRIEEERENFRRALDTALELEPEQALDLAGRLGLYWNRRGQWREGRRWLAAALAAAPAVSPSLAFARISEAGNLALWQADVDAAEQLGREALALAREHNDRRGTAYALNLLGMVSGSRGDDGAANERYEESLAEYEAAGDDAGRLLALQNLASSAISKRITSRRSRSYARRSQVPVTARLTLSHSPSVCWDSPSRETARMMRRGSRSKRAWSCAARTASHAHKRRF